MHHGQKQNDPMLAKVNLSIIWLSRINTQINYIDGQITISKSIINRYVSLDVVDFANSLDKCADLLSVNFVSCSSPPFYLKSEVAIEFVSERKLRSVNKNSMHQCYKLCVFGKNSPECER